MYAKYIYNGAFMSSHIYILRTFC